MKQQPYPERGERAKKNAKTAGFRGHPVMPAAKYRAPMKGMTNANC